MAALRGRALAASLAWGVRPRRREWWARLGSNQRPLRCQRSAHTAELRARLPKSPEFKLLMNPNIAC
jgi:hypothetical protein